MCWYFQFKKTSKKKELRTMEAVVKRLEDVATRLETVANLKPALPPKPATLSGSNIAVQSSDVPAAVRQFDEEVAEALKAFVSASKQIGQDVGIMCDKVTMVFDLLRSYIWHAAGRQPPPAQEQQTKQKPLVNLLNEIGELKESKRNTANFNHLSAVSEGIPAVGWINVKPTPAPFVKEMLEASMFFVNRVRTDNKANQVHQEWTKAWCELLTALHKYVKQAHTTGLVWNSTPGASPPDHAAPAGAPTKPQAGGPPGPPPPPPPPPADFFDKPAKSDSSARQALFADINKGEDVTRGLKKVTADMQTHKNPNLRGASTVPAKATSTPAKSPTSPAKAAVEKPPKTELQDYKTWAVEYHKGNKDIVIEVTDLKQCVYVFRCENSVVQVKGKVNSVTIDGCKKTSVVFDSLLSQVEIINSQSVEVQSLGAMPTVSIQKTDGCQVYLSKESLGAEIVTSKSSEMNILAPKGDDFVELPVPEQFKTVYDPATNKLITTVSDIV